MVSINYTAITIGPIYSTMQLTTSPAGLWGASYLFSYIAKQLIQCLVSGKSAISPECFIAPYFELDKEHNVILSDKDDVCEKMRSYGVGLFHDRIIFCSQENENSLALVRDAREQVIQALAEKLNQELGRSCDEWLHQYLRIYAVEMPVPENQSPLIYLGQYLSAMELEPQFSSCEKTNRLLALFENADRYRFKNLVLKESFLCRELDGDWMLFQPGTGNIKNLKDIASQSDKPAQQKYQQYYAVLKSDGDSMGKILESLSTDEEVRQYSRKCLSFCAEAADIIQAFGGMPIYAGGDDLLALVPVVGKGTASIFALVEELRTAFNLCFKLKQNTPDGNPTISFGVAVQFYKSPLYEALERANDMLRKAKSSDGKNACFLNLQKHSGQSILIFEQQMDKTVPNLFAHLETLFQKTRQKSAKENLTFLSSAGYQVEAFGPLFYEAIRNKDHRSKMLKNLFDNLFDNTDQQQFQSYLAELNVLTELIFNEQEGSASKEDLVRCIDLTCAAIRAIHFMNESKEED